MLLLMLISILWLSLKVVNKLIELVLCVMTMYSFRSKSNFFLLHVHSLYLLCWSILIFSVKSHTLLMMLSGITLDLKLDLKLN